MLTSFTRKSFLLEKLVKTFSAATAARVVLIQFELDWRKTHPRRVQPPHRIHQFHEYKYKCKYYLKSGLVRRHTSGACRIHKFNLNCAVP